MSNQLPTLSMGVLQELKACRRRDCKWMLLILSIIIALILVMSLIVAFNTANIISLKVLFILQMTLSILFLFTIPWIRLYGLSASMYMFFQCYVLMLGSGELTRNIKHEEKGEKEIAIAAWTFSSFGSCIYVIVVLGIGCFREVRRMYGVHYRRSLTKGNMLPNRTFFEFMKWKKSERTLILEE